MILESDGREEGDVLRNTCNTNSSQCDKGLKHVAVKSSE